MTDEAPKLLKGEKTRGYANRLFEILDRDAKDRVIAGKRYKLWQGRLVETCQSIGVPLGVERRVSKLLEEIGSIEILQRGNAHYPSMVAVLEAPTTDRWEIFSTQKSLTGQPTIATLSREVRDLSEAMGGVVLSDVLVNIEDRLVNLERAVKELSGK